MATMEVDVGPGVEEVLERAAALEPLIRAASDEAETACRVSDHVAEALKEAGIFHLYRPKSLGGLGLDPVSGLKVIEELARIDSAVGWNVALPNSQEPFGAWLSEETAAEIFGSPDTVLAGSFFPARKAVSVEGGYRLSGRCTFNSNCHAATWIMGLAHVHDSDGPRLDENGQPATLLTFFRKEDGRIIDNWDTLGMRGTGSHDVACDDLFVPADRAISFAPLETPSPAYAGPFHRLTIWPSIATNAVPALGIAQAAIDDFVDLARKKTPSYTTTTLRDRPVVQLRFAKAVAKVESARAYVHEVFEDAWQRARAGRDLEMADRARLQRAISNAPLAAAEAVDLIHSLVGTAGIRNDGPFQRYFRDVHVLTQHAYTSESRLTAVGQVAFGLDPDWGFFHF
ncbi:MAG: acyl-CoA dehydrogenase family protein [Gemmatimonadota bacterium]|nr:acyl-CoA dehydrogenase family protein [Gemmatimonadota bacterium]